MFPINGLNPPLYGLTETKGLGLSSKCKAVCHHGVLKTLQGDDASCVVQRDLPIMYCQQLVGTYFMYVRKSM